MAFEKGRSQARVGGTLHLTSHHLLFVPGENEPGQEVWVIFYDSDAREMSSKSSHRDQIGYSTIHSVDKKSPTADGLFPLYISCRNFAFVRLFIGREQDCNEAYATLQRVMNISGHPWSL